MVIDYERAWTEFLEHVSTKTQHGREQLLTEAAQIAARCRVDVGEMPRVLRLYGVEVARSISAANSPTEELTLPAGFGSAGEGSLGAHHRSEDHDVAGNGAGRSG